jgi:hypothetical protein
MVAEWGKPTNSPSFEEFGMLPSITAPQPGNIEARKTSSGIPEQPHKLASTVNSMKGQAFTVSCAEPVFPQPARSAEGIPWPQGPQHQGDAGVRLAEAQH